MDQETKQLLQETLDLSRENNKMLRQVRSVQKWSAFWRAIKLVIILGLAFGSFYYIEPYLNKMLDLYTSISNAQQKLNGGASGVQDFLKNLNLEELKKIQN